MPGYFLSVYAVCYYDIPYCVFALRAMEKDLNEWMNEVFIKNSQTAVVTIGRW